MAEMLYFTPGGARITGPPPTSGNYLSRRADDPRALVGPSRYTGNNPAYVGGTERRAGLSATDLFSPGQLARSGITQDEFNQAYASLSDADRVRTRYMSPTWVLQQAGMRDQPAPGSGFGGASPYDPGAASPPITRPTVPPGTPPASPFDPSYDPLPPPAVLPPENPAVPPTPPAPPWVNQQPAAPAAPPIAQPPPAVTPPGPPSSAAPAPLSSPSQGAAPTPSGGGGVGPGPYPPFLGGQATWGNPTDPYMLPFSPGSILPPGRGGNPPAWWNEIRQPQQIAPPMWPTTARNPYLGNAGGFNIGTPYFAPMSSWGFYPMPHMSQHMPGSFGMATPGMGSWFTGAPVGFNPSPGAATSMNPPAASPSNAPNPVQANMPNAQNTPMGFGTQTGYGFTPNMAGSMQANTRPSWMTSGMYLG